MSAANQDLCIVLGFFQEMAIVRISSMRCHAERKPFFLSDHKTCFASKLVGFMGLALGDARDLRLMAAVDLVLVLFCLDQQLCTDGGFSQQLSRAALKNRVSTLDKHLLSLLRGFCAFLHRFLCISL